MSNFFKKSFIYIAFLILSVAIGGCGPAKKGELITQENGCPFIVNNSSKKIISFTIQYLDERKIIGSTIKVLKPGEVKELRNCKGTTSKIVGAVEVAPINYEQHLKLER